MWRWWPNSAACIQGTVFPSVLFSFPGWFHRQILLGFLYYDMYFCPKTLLRCRGCWLLIFFLCVNFWLLIPLFTLVSIISYCVCAIFVLTFALYSYFRHSADILTRATQGQGTWILWGLNMWPSCYTSSLWSSLPYISGLSFPLNTSQEKHLNLSRKKCFLVCFVTLMYLLKLLERQQKGERFFITVNI